jgi:hypothetical protein
MRPAPSRSRSASACCRKTRTRCPAPAGPAAGPAPVQAAGVNPRTVTVNDQTIELTPAQAAQWDAADEEASAERAAVKARFASEKKMPAGDDPDVGIKSAKDRHDAAMKRIGMELSAKRRKIAGAQTAKEKANDAKDAAKHKAGDRVTVDGKPGTVLGTPFGKVKVQLDGQEKHVTVPRRCCHERSERCASTSTG